MNPSGRVSDGYGVVAPWHGECIACRRGSVIIGSRPTGDCPASCRSGSQRNGFTAEEHSIIGGLGAAVAETLAEKGFTGRFKRMGIKDVFCESGEPKDLLEKYELNEKHIVKNVKNLIS